MKEKILEEQRAKGRLDDAVGFPRVVLIDTVSYCNLKCSMCVHRTMTRKRGVMPWGLFTGIIDEIADTDPTVRVWMVFFGEALILKRTTPSIFDMIAYAKGKGLTDVVLNSNMNLLDGASAKKLVASGLDAIYIGIDAFKPETYAKLRVGGSYDRVVKQTKGLIETRDEMGSRTPEVYVQFVEMDINKDEKDEFISYWSSCGANVKIRPKVSWGGMIEAPNLVLGREDRWPCYWAMRTMSITDRGLAVTCAVDLDARYVAGDVNERKISEIWNGPLKDLRRLHLEGRYDELPGICRDCRDWQSARADYYSQNPDESQE
ncbi:MAG: radical SAM/SPASM domain-containing protein [Candidatus Xenobiia bacterium LiM19]